MNRSHPHRQTPDDSQSSYQRDAFDLEAYRQLSVDCTPSRFAPLSSDFLLQHLSRILPVGCGWPVQRESLRVVGALMVRVRERPLAIVKRPRAASGLGEYLLEPGPAGSSESSGSSRSSKSHPAVSASLVIGPRRVLLRSLAPLDASCGCLEYLQNSLGLCEHILRLLCVLCENRTRWREMQRARPLRRKGFRWDPVRPLTGIGHWLQRVVAEGVEALPSVGTQRGHTAAVKVLATDLAQRVSPDPALQELLKQELHRQQLVRGLGAARRRLQKLPAELLVTLYPYQKDAVKKFLRTGRLLLGDDMGLGKTVQAIAIARSLISAGLTDRVLVISPAALKRQWLEEWARFDPGTAAMVVSGAPKVRAAIYSRVSRGVLFANYEQLLRDLHLMQQWSPDLVVLDEAQRIKNWQTKTACAAKKLTPPYRLVLTGTPLENRLEDLVSIVDWIDPHSLAPQWRVAPWHSQRADGSTEIVGVGHLRNIRERIDSVFLRRTRAQVLKHLPPRRGQEFIVKMSIKQEELHRYFRRKIIEVLKRLDRPPIFASDQRLLMELLTKQRIVANGLAQRSFADVWPQLQRQPPTDEVLAELDMPKLQVLRELVSTILERRGSKLVVFSQWRRALTLIHWSLSELLSSRKERAVFFTGEEGQKRRVHNIVDFHDDPATRILLASDAGGTGLNLQRASSVCVNFEMPWNPAVLEQRIGRIYRIGQSKPVDVYSLVSALSIEERLCAILGSKQALFTTLLETRDDSVKFACGASIASLAGRLFEDEVIEEDELDL